MRYIIFLLSTFCMLNVNSTELDHPNKVDSLFLSNISDLRNIISKSTEDVVINKTCNIEFLYVVSLLSGKDFAKGDPHHITINQETIDSIQQWYESKKTHIKYEKVQKAYSLLRPPLDDNFNIEDYSRELDQIKIQ